jgi:hypothetical protein
MMKRMFLLLSVAILGAAGARAQETVLQQMGRSQDTMAQIAVARFQQEQADRAAKEADEIRQVALAAQAAREAREADLEKEIERCLQAGLPVPTEASWVKPTSYEQERAKFHALMWEQMNDRLSKRTAP